MQRIGELSMENELLRSRIERPGTVRIFVCAGRPFTDQACALAKR
jgi:hypothetical protein